MFPYLTLSGIYDFNKLQDIEPTDAALVSSNEDFRARLEAGAVFLVPDRNIKIAVEGFYHGIGVSDYESSGATVSIQFAF